MSNETLYNETYNKTKQIVTEYLKLAEGELQPDTHVMDDLGADSLALIEIGFRISEAFSIPIIEATEENFVFENLINTIIKQLEVPLAQAS